MTIYYYNPIVKKKIRDRKKISIKSISVNLNSFMVKSVSINVMEESCL
jgi:hypothetical protein